MVSAQLTGGLAERYGEGEPEEGDDQKKSEYLRELLQEAITHRDETIYERLSLSDNVLGVLEADRREGESRELVVRRGLNEVAEYRQGDVLDTLEASEELRTRVETVQREDESLEAVSRRLLREGAEVSTPAAKKLETARRWAEWFAVIFIVFAGALSVPGSALSRTLPIVPITGEQVIAGALLVTLFFYFTNRAGAWRAGRGEGK